jgi:hypothetical protein
MVVLSVGFDVTAVDVHPLAPNRSHKTLPVGAVLVSNDMHVGLREKPK